MIVLGVILMGIGGIMMLNNCQYGFNANLFVILNLPWIILFIGGAICFAIATSRKKGQEEQHNNHQVESSETDNIQSTVDKIETTPSIE